MQIVYYHNVVGDPIDAYDRRLSRITRDEFARQIDAVTRRLRPVSLPEMLERREPGTIAFTFDDGFRGVLAHAFPVLAERGIPASVFVVTTRLEDADDAIFHFDEIEIAFRLTRRRLLRLPLLGPIPHPMATPFGRVWTLKRLKRRLKVKSEDERLVWHARVLAALDVPAETCRAHARSLEKYRTLTRAELQQLIDAGWTVGAHTRTHRTLSCLPQDELHDEVDGSRRDLERLLGLRDMPFAYPYGEPAHISADAEREVANAGFTCGLTTIPGANTADVGRFTLRRYTFEQLMDDVSKQRSKT